MISIQENYEQYPSILWLNQIYFIKLTIKNTNKNITPSFLFFDHSPLLKTFFNRIFKYSFSFANESFTYFMKEIEISFQIKT